MVGHWLPSSSSSSSSSSPSSQDELASTLVAILFYLPDSTRCDTCDDLPNRDTDVVIFSGWYAESSSFSVPELWPARHRGARVRDGPSATTSISRVCVGVPLSLSLSLSRRLHLSTQQPSTLAHEFDPVVPGSPHRSTLLLLVSKMDCTCILHMHAAGRRLGKLRRQTIQIGLLPCVTGLSSVGDTNNYFHCWPVASRMIMAAC